MPNGDIEVAVIGGGAAGIAAARHLHEMGVDCLIVEARPRLGGRAWTVAAPDGTAIDLGCGWLHSADRNPWVPIAEAQGRRIDKTPPPWNSGALTAGFTPDEQRDFGAAMEEFHARVAKAADAKDDVVAAALAPGNRWNGLIGAIATYISGAEPECISARDFDNYENTEVNWRVPDGYGTAIVAHADGVPAVLGCPVRRIDHGGKRLKIETAKGTIAADCAIVTLPTDVLVGMEDLFAPALPTKVQAARDLPLGLDDKLFIALAKPEEFASGSRLFGAKDRTATAAYHVRPFGRAQIEAYFGGSNARALEAQGERAFFDFAVTELTAMLGHDFGRRLTPIRIHCWGLDPFARGAYSFARPGKAASRALLAAPVDGRLFFAGEACSKGDFSTAHGGYLTGLAAAALAIAVREGKH
jgi:monoamine oxidase